MSAPARGGGLRPLQRSLADWRPGMGRTAEPLHVIAAAWPGIVGADVAAQAMPLELSGGVLVVGTRSSAWSQQLQFLSLPILAGVRALGGEIVVERLVFRTGTVPRARRRGEPAPSERMRARPASDPFVPAASLEEAFERLRSRMSRGAPPAVACQACGVSISPPPATLALRRVRSARPARCAPCAGAADRERTTAIERCVYMAPWLSLEELRGEIPDLGVAEFERARTRLLSRWWLVLERARRSGRVSATGIERHVGSSYVLLHSRLSPDRITPAVVRNLLGTELETLLWPHSGKASPARSSNGTA
ncbi:MAG: hypothetical protein NVSMB21_04560 [Vulcanimicrobiaceae bacterium]